MEWQPIKTAPKDGTVVIVRGFYDCYGTPMQATAAQFRENYGYWMRDNFGTGYTVSCNPTHWMPLPEPPKETA